jgi:hypothetical protein
VLLQHGSANNKTVGGYWAKFKHLQEFCEKNAWDPLIFSLELAVLFACAMMNRIWGGNYIQDVDDYFSAFNHVYPRLPQPRATVGRRRNDQPAEGFQEGTGGPVRRSRHGTRQLAHRCTLLAYRRDAERV